MKWPWMRRARLDKVIEHYAEVCARNFSRQQYWEREALMLHKELRAAHKGIARLKRRIKRLENANAPD